MIWFKGIRVKLMLLVLMPTFMIAGIVASTYLFANGLSDQLEHSNRVKLPLQTYSGAMQTTLQERMKYFWSAYANPEIRSDEIERARSSSANFKKALAGFTKLPLPEWAAKPLAGLSARWEISDNSLNEALNELEKNTPAGDKKAKEILLTVTRSASADVELILEDLDQTRLKMSLDEAAVAEKATAQKLFYMMGSGVAGALTLLLFGFFFASRLARKFNEVAAGIHSSVHQFTSVSSQLSTASQTLSSGSSEAAASLEETVASLEELSSMVKQNAEHSHEAGVLSGTARSSAEQGEHEVRNLVGAMQEITSSSRKIEEITGVIDDLAFQTNLLALNAAVEAARAGEQGKGFAVVAEAVRSLAHRSGEAAKSINVLIKESVASVERGSAIASKSANVLHEIVGNVKKVADLNQEIASASQEQSTGISQISKAMNQLDQATQGNAASAEETASSSEELSAEARSLTSLVGVLMNEIEGGGIQAVVAIDESRPLAPKGRGGSPKVTRLHVGDHRQRAADAIPFGDEAPAPKVSNFKGF